MNINTLIADIYALLKKKDNWFDDTLAQTFTGDLAKKLQEQLGTKHDAPTLRLSQMGPRCPRALWYSINRAEEAEKLPPWAEIKYAFGHIIEALAIVLAKAAKHEVTGEQDELRYEGIVGHRDCVIDGCVLDVKSSSSIAFTKFKNAKYVDTFGYLDQLDGYVCASRDDPKVTVKDKGYLLVVDKQLGHMFLYEHEVTDERERALRERIASYKSIVIQREPPPCECGTILQGASGNIQLDVKASYSPFKHSCFPNLRTFLYASGPVFFTRVNKRPFNKDGPIIEVDKHGQIC